MHHTHDSQPGAPVRGLIRGVVLLVAVSTVIGLVLLWPTGDAPDLSTSRVGIEYVDATVTSVEIVGCTDPEEGVPTECQSVGIDIDSGPTAGESSTFLSSLIDFSAPTFSPGDSIVLAYNDLAPETFQYSFVDYRRQAPLAVLAIVFVVVVAAFGRWKGIRALAGLALSFAVIIGFLLPSLLRDNNPLAVALVTTSVIAFAALYLAHGINRSTTIALIGTLGSILVITTLATVASGAAELTGLSDQSVQVLRVTAQAIDPRGVLLAGIVIGALGVLDDVTVTQVSAVDELRRADPTMSRRQLYAAAINIGRDHVAATVNTLVLAYIGASLALMLFFFQEGRSVGQVLNREIVAIEIVRMLAGSIGLILSVPITTGLAVAVLDEPAGAGASVDRGD
jgi:uncharacterized membrane protein